MKAAALLGLAAEGWPNAAMSKQEAFNRISIPPEGDTIHRIDVGHRSIRANGIAA